MPKVVEFKSIFNFLSPRKQDFWMKIKFFRKFIVFGFHSSVIVKYYQVTFSLLTLYLESNLPRQGVIDLQPHLQNRCANTLSIFEFWLIWFKNSSKITLRLKVKTFHNLLFLNRFINQCHCVCGRKQGHVNRVSKIKCHNIRSHAHIWFHAL